MKSEFLKKLLYINQDLQENYNSLYKAFEEEIDHTHRLLRKKDAEIERLKKVMSDRDEQLMDPETGRIQNPKELLSEIEFYKTQNEQLKDDLRDADDTIDELIENLAEKGRGEDYDKLYKEWRMKNEACNEAYGITIPTLKKEIERLREDCLNSISFDAHEKCCNEHARQVAKAGLEELEKCDCMCLHVVNAKVALRADLKKMKDNDS